MLFLSEMYIYVLRCLLGLRGLYSPMLQIGHVTNPEDTRLGLNQDLMEAYPQFEFFGVEVHKHKIQTYTIRSTYNIVLWDDMNIILSVSLPGTTTPLRLY